MNYAFESNVCYFCFNNSVFTVNAADNKQRDKNMTAIKITIDPWVHHYMIFNRVNFCLNVVELPFLEGKYIFLWLMLIFESIVFPSLIWIVKIALHALKQ